MRMKGKLIKWNNEKSFGFISPNGTGEHVFTHKTALSNRNRIHQVTVRATLVGYLLRIWNVDCTEDANLSDGEYQLWLINRQTLYGTENFAIAPGYKN